jgi:hypothetical protein
MFDFQAMNPSAERALVDLDTIEIGNASSALARR